MVVSKRKPVSREDYDDETSSEEDEDEDADELDEENEEADDASEIFGKHGLILDICGSLAEIIAL